MITKAEAPKAPVLPPAAAMVAAKVRAATKAGAGFYDPAVRKLRAELADALKAALLEEHFAAQVSHLNTSPMHCTRRHTALFEAHHSALGGLCLMCLLCSIRWTSFCHGMHAEGGRGADALEGGLLPPDRGVPAPHPPGRRRRRPRLRAAAQGGHRLAQSSASAVQCKEQSCNWPMDQLCLLGPCDSCHVMPLEHLVRTAPGLSSRHNICFQTSTAIPDLTSALPRPVQAKAAFNQLLDSGAGFYRRLALDVQAVHGDSGCPVHFPREPASPLAAAGGGAPAAPGDAGAPIDARPTVFRCLICLGDLARWGAAHV